MKIKIELVASCQVGLFETKIQDYSIQPTVRQIINDVGLANHKGVISLINGVHAGSDDLLSNQDTLTLLPLIDGG